MIPTSTHSLRIHLVKVGCALNLPQNVRSTRSDIVLTFAINKNVRMLGRSFFHVDIVGSLVVGHIPLIFRKIEVGEIG